MSARAGRELEAPCGGTGRGKPARPAAVERRKRSRRARRSQAAGLALLLLAMAATMPAAAQTASGGAVLRARLDNGLRVVVVRNRLAPVVTTVVNYLVGSNEAPPGFPGMAHAEEHMMFRGSPGLSADELAAIGAAMGGSFDADTQQTVTQYFFTVPAEELDVALHIESIRMSGILDTEALWRKERGAIEQEVARDLSSPEYVMYTKLLSDLFQGTVYAHDALGTRASFERTTAAMLKRFYERWYAPNNAILVVVGDVEPQAALERVRSLFGAIPARTIPQPPRVRLGPVRPETLRLATDRPYALAVAALRLPGSESPDYAAARVLADVLGSRRGKLYELAVNGQALFAGFSLNGMPAASLGYALAALPAGQDADKLLRQVKAVLERVKAEGVSSDLVQAAKRQELSSAELQKNSVSGLAMAWSRALAVEGRDSPEALARAIQAVTVEDVNRVARSVLDLDHSVTTVLTPQPSGAPVAGKGFGGQESFAAKPGAPVSLPDWARQALSRLQVPPATVSPQVSTLSNGITLIVQPETISDTVGVFGRVESNSLLQVPQGKEGLGSLTERLFAFGTTSLDRAGFQKALDDIGASVSAGTSFSLEVLSDHFERGLQLLADNLLHPAFPEQAFRILQRQLAGTVAGRRQSPDYKAGRALDRALLPEGDQGLREATPATVQGLTLQDAREYYRKVFRPDMTTIVVIGNVSPQRARRAVEDAFRSWRASGARPQVLLPPVPANKAATIDVPDSSRVQDSVTLAETAGLTLSSPDRYALELGNHVLGGAFYATRLYRDLREEQGLVYNVSSSFDFGRTRSFYSVDYACDPGNVSRVRSIVERDIRQMQAAPVSAAELRQAKAILLREIPLSDSSVHSIAGRLLYLATHDLPLDEPQQAARKYLALSAAQVQAAFARWVRLEDLVQVSQGPPAR